MPSNPPPKDDFCPARFPLLPFQNLACELSCVQVPNLRIFGGGGGALVCAADFTFTFLEAGRGIGQSVCR